MYPLRSAIQGRRTPGTPQVDQIEGRAILGVTQPPLLSIGIPLLLIALALALWGSKLRAINLAQMTDLGLVSVLPGTFFAALLLLTLSFCLSLRQREISSPLLLLHILILILILYGTTSLIEEVPRFESVWKHVGVSEYIMRTGAVAPEISAYFDWPGFFILISFGTAVVGANDPLAVAMWFPLIINVLSLGPLLLILKAATSDKRVIWLGIWLFYVTNWIGQDYFSPQALNYFLYLVMIAILVGWFKAPRATSPASIAAARSTLARRWLEQGRRWLTPTETIPNSASSAGQRAGLLAILIALFATIIASHQLTPFAIIGSVTMLVLLGRTRPRGLPILLVVLTASWLSFMATAYLAGNAAGLLSALGQVSSSVDSNVTNRLRGSPEHIVVIYARLAMSVAIWGLALLGGLRILRQGERPLTFAILAITPFFLVIVQPYGGEMLLRVYLFVLPYMAFFAAKAFYVTAKSGRSWATTIAIAVVSITLLSGFLLTRYGNERADNFTADEVAALGQLYEVAEPGSLFIDMSENMPFRFRDFEKFTYLQGFSALQAGGMQQLIARMEQGKYPQRYLILTQSQRAAVELYNGLPPGEWDRITAEIQASPRFRLIIANDAVQIYRLVDDRAAGQP